MCPCNKLLAFDSTVNSYCKHPDELEGTSFNPVFFYLDVFRDVRTVSSHIMVVCVLKTYTLSDIIRIAPKSNIRLSLATSDRLR